MSLSGTHDAMTGVGQRLQASFGYGFLALFAEAEGFQTNALQCFADLLDHLFLILQQAERELLLEIIAGHVRDIYRMREVAGLAVG